MRGRRGTSGFTLLEVMIALAILAGGLTIFVHRTAANITLAQRDQMLGVAADLARAKMYEIEELLLEEGFQELAEELDGDFSDEGREEIEWQAKIEKIELPNLLSLEKMGDESEGTSGTENQSGPLGGGMLGGMLGIAGGAGGGGAGAALISSQYELFRRMLEESIRKVTVTLSWAAGGFDEELVVNCYFTDPAAMNRVVMGVGEGPTGSGDNSEGAEQ